MRLFTWLLLAGMLAMSAPAADKWVAAWTGASHGPYPSGNAVAQPDLAALLPGAVANDQSFRLIVRPGLWGSRARIRLSNVFGSQPVTLDGVFIGVHGMGGSLVPGTNRPVKFAGGKMAVISASRTAFHGHDTHTEITGSKGILKIGMKGGAEGSPEGMTPILRKLAFSAGFHFVFLLTKTKF